MPTQNGFNTGDDVTLVVQPSTGPALQFALTNFKAKAGYVDLKTRIIGQKPVHDYIPDGWSGEFRLDRTDPNVDTYFAQGEANYFNGIVNSPGTIYQTVQESNGAISKWRYDKVALKLDDAGDYAGPKRVEQVIGFMASGKTRVA